MDRRQAVTAIGLSLLAIGDVSRIVHAANPITQSQLDNWASEYAGLLSPGVSAYYAWQAWIATGPSREVPQLNAITYRVLGLVFNTMDLSLHNDPGSQFRNKPATLNFFNDLVNTGGAAYPNACQVLIYYDGSTMKVEPFRVP